MTYEIRNEYDEVLEKTSTAIVHLQKGDVIIVRDRIYEVDNTILNLDTFIYTLWVDEIE